MIISWLANNAWEGFAYLNDDFYQIEGRSGQTSSCNHEIFVRERRLDLARLTYIVSVNGRRRVPNITLPPRCTFYSACFFLFSHIRRGLDSKWSDLPNQQLMISMFCVDRLGGANEGTGWRGHGIVLCGLGADGGWDARTTDRWHPALPASRHGLLLPGHR